MGLVMTACQSYLTSPVFALPLAPHCGLPSSALPLSAQQNKRPATSLLFRRLPTCAVRICVVSSARSGSAQWYARVSDNSYERAAS
jgi:hypothetical protein